MEGPWNLILTAVLINFLLVRVVTRIFTKPTGITVVDETIMYLNTQNGFLLNSTLVLALSIWLADYWLSSSSDVTPAISSKV